MSELKVNDWMDMVDINIKGVWNVTRAVAPIMMAKKEGRIVIMSSVTGDMVIRSVVCTVVSLFAFTATAFCIGSFSKGPTTMAPFFLMTVVLPLLLVLVSLRYGIEELLQLPVFLPDTALVSLGSSVMGSVNGFFSILGVSFIDIADLGTMLVIGVVWGLAFLILGMFRIMRREM